MSNRRLLLLLLVVVVLVVVGPRRANNSQTLMLSISPKGESCHAQEINFMFRRYIYICDRLTINESQHKVRGEA